MKKEGKPVPSLDKLEKIAAAFQATDKAPAVDFSNTKNAFIDKNDEELKKTAWLFGLMNNPRLVAVGGKLAMLAAKLRLPFFESIVKKTIFRQFCGGATLLVGGNGPDPMTYYVRLGTAQATQGGVE